MTLDHRRELFAYEYTKDLCGAAAARRIGIPAGSARSEACRMLAEPEVKELIDELLEARKKAANITAEQILAELAGLAFFDPAHAYDPQTNALKPIHDMPENVRKALIGVDVYEEFVGKGEDRAHVGNTIKAKFADRGAHLERLMRHLGMLKDKVEIEASDALIERLIRGRERAGGS